MHGRQASSRKVQFWFPDKSDWERADRQAVSGPKLRKERSRKRKERKRQQKIEEKKRKDEKLKIDVFRHSAKAKGVGYYGNILAEMFLVFGWVGGPQAITIPSLTAMFVERLDVGTELTTDDGDREWKTLFSALHMRLKNSWDHQFSSRNSGQQPEITAPTGVDPGVCPLPDIIHPVYSEGDELLHKLFFLLRDSDLDSFIEEEEMFKDFFKLAYEKNLKDDERRARFKKGTMCVSDVSTGLDFFIKHKSVLELKEKLVCKFALVWDKDENSEEASTSGSEDERNADDQDFEQIVQDADEPAGPVAGNP